jgi:hypothetical protein
VPDPHRAARLRIASMLLAPRDSEGVARSPLSDDQAMASIRAMPKSQVAHLTGQINWVREYEANEVPEHVSTGEAR